MNLELTQTFKSVKNLLMYPLHSCTCRYSNSHFFKLHKIKLYVTLRCICILNRVLWYYDAFYIRLYSYLNLRYVGIQKTSFTDQQLTSLSLPTPKLKFTIRKQNQQKHAWQEKKIWFLFSAHKIDLGLWSWLDLLGWTKVFFVISGMYCIARFWL